MSERKYAKNVEKNIIKKNIKQKNLRIKTLNKILIYFFPNLDLKTYLYLILLDRKTIHYLFRMVKKSFNAKSLRSLNTLNLTTKNTLTGRSILIFGPSHVKSLHKISLNQQHKKINEFKKVLEVKKQEGELKEFKKQNDRKIKQLKKEYKLINEKLTDIGDKIKELSVKKAVQKVDKPIEINQNNFTCLAIFYTRVLIDEQKDNNQDKRKFISDSQGRIYKQIFASYANVSRGIISYNNRRTYRPSDDDPILNKVRWNSLIGILSNDPKIKDMIELITLSGEIDCIIIKNVVEQKEVKNPHNPLKRRLFNDVESQFICRNDITYQLNKKATTFSEMFGLSLDRYTIDNFRANSCFITLIVDTWHNEFEKLKSDGKRMYSELTYESVCKIVCLTCKNQDLGLSISESVKFFEKYHLGLDVI
jgi:hypothetical protein